MLGLEVTQIGELMNAPTTLVAVHGNFTQCCTVVASCFDFAGRRKKVVYTDMNFPSVMYFWEAKRSQEARVHMVAL
jgi:kynureninase